MALGPDITGLPSLVFLKDEWLCTFCGEMKKEGEEDFWFDERYFCTDCAIDLMTPCDEVQGQLYKSGLWE